METIERKCILRDPCENAGVEGACSTLCPHYIALHGINGESGKVGSSNIPEEYRTYTATTSPVRQSQPDIYKAVDAYVKTFRRQFEEDAEDIKNLYMIGGVGTGKSATASAIANEFQIRHHIGSVKRGLKPNKMPAYFLDMSLWQELYNTSNKGNIPRDIAESASHDFIAMQEIAKKTPLLIIDDIGLRGANTFVDSLLNVINYRNSREYHPTIYTANVPIEELETLYKPQVADRVRDRCIVLTFKGESKRGRR